MLLLDIETCSVIVKAEEVKQQGRASQRYNQCRKLVAEMLEFSALQTDTISQQNEAKP